MAASVVRTIGPFKELLMLMMVFRDRAFSHCHLRLRTLFSFLAAGLTVPSDDRVSPAPPELWTPPGCLSSAWAGHRTLLIKILQSGMEMSVGASLSLFSMFIFLQRRPRERFVFLVGPQLGVKQGKVCGFNPHFLEKWMQTLLWWDDSWMCVQYLVVRVTFLRICCFICEHLVFKLCDKQH